MGMFDDLIPPESKGGMFDDLIPEKPEDQSIFRSIADVPLKVGQGAVMGTRMISEAFGADNVVADKLQTAEDYLGSLMSAQSKEDSAEVGRLMAEAEGKGFGEEVKAGLKAFGVAPIDFMANAAGTIAPIIAGTALAPAGAATTAAGLGLGAVMGAGVTKSAIHEGVLESMIEAGVPEDKAMEAAEEAQKYTGENLDQIALGTVLGAWAARSGIEPAIARMVAKEATEKVSRSLASRMTTGALVEGVPEAIQGGQERLAQNIAEQREGFDTPTWAGVAGQGTMEGLAGLGLGMGVGAISGGKPVEPPPPEDVPRETPPGLPAPQDQLPPPQGKLADDPAGRLPPPPNQLPPPQQRLPAPEQERLEWERGRIKKWIADNASGPDGFVTGPEAEKKMARLRQIEEVLGPEPLGPIQMPDENVYEEAPSEYIYMDELGNFWDQDGNIAVRAEEEAEPEGDVYMDEMGNFLNPDGSPAVRPLGVQRPLPSTPDTSMADRRKTKELKGFRKDLMGKVNDRVAVERTNLQEAAEEGVFDGFEVGTKLKGKTGPLEILGYGLKEYHVGEVYKRGRLQKNLADRYFNEKGITPTIVEKGGKTYIPMLWYQSADGGKGQLYLDGVRDMPQFSGLKPVASTADNRTADQIIQDAEFDDSPSPYDYVIPQGKYKGQTPYNLSDNQIAEARSIAAADGDTSTELALKLVQEDIQRDDEWDTAFPASTSSGQSGISLEQLQDTTNKTIGKRLGKTVNIVKSAEQIEGYENMKQIGDYEGLYDPATKQVHLIADNIESEERAKWVVWHELFHRGVRVKYAEQVENALKIAANNGTVNKLAQAVMLDRNMPKEQFYDAVEEALAELNAATRTGEYEAINARYKVEVPTSLQAGWRSSLKRFLQVLKNIYSKVTGVKSDTVSDADVWGMFYGNDVDVMADPETTDEDVMASRRRRTKSGKSKGQYVGYPEGIDTPGKLGGLLRRVRNLAKEGMYGRFWYERSSKEILNLVKGDKTEADKLVQAIAVTSPTTPVGANFDYAVQAYLQWKRGVPIRTGKYPGKMGEKLTDIFNGVPWGGRKTNNFYNNLMREIDPTRAQGVTTDIWMMRAFGFFQDAPSDVMYTAVENETNRIADQLGWEPQQVQAAIWVALKARMQNNGVKHMTDQSSVRRGYIKFVPDSKGKPVREIIDGPAHMKNWMAHAMRHVPTDLDKDNAKFDYKDAAANTLAQVSWETRPGRTTDHMPEAQTASDAVLKEYHVAISKAFLDANGDDYIAKELGIPSPGDFEGPGYFEGRLSPGTQTEILAPRKFKGKAFGEIEQSAIELINAYAATRGILLRQDAMGWHRPWAIGRTPSGKWNIPLKHGNGADISIGRPFTGAEIAKLAEIMADLSGHTEFNPIPSPNGVRLINWAFLGGDNRAFQKLVKQGLETMQFDNNEAVNVDLFHAASDYLVNDWRIDKNGEGYYANGTAGKSDLQRRVRSIVNKIKPRIEAVEEEFAAKHGWTRGQPLASTKPARDALRSDERGDQTGRGIRPSTSFRAESQRGITLNPRPVGGSAPIKGIHYGNFQQNILSADKYGTGYKGAERQRLDGAADERIKRRVYFYINKQTGLPMRPESGVGSYVHTQTFGNVLNLMTDTDEFTKLWATAKELLAADEEAGRGWPNIENSFDSAVIDAGYDGFAIPQNGMMVILNQDVPVNYQGTAGELRMEGTTWDKALNNDRLTVTESSDVMSMLGERNLPITVMESKMSKIDDEHNLSDQDWDRIPEWLANPIAVFESDTDPDRLVFIAPDPAAKGGVVRLVVSPQRKKLATDRHLLVSAYETNHNPFHRWIRQGKLKYANQQMLRGRDMEWLGWPGNINIKANRQGLPKLKGKGDLDAAVLANIEDSQPMDGTLSLKPSIRPTYADPELQSASERVGQGETWRSKWLRFKDKNWGAALTQGVFDRYYGIKQALEATGREFAANINGYVSARLSTSIQDRMAVLLKHSQIEWVDGVLTPIEGTKGFLEILEPISDKIDDFGLYLVGLRAEELARQDIETGFTRGEIAAMVNLGRTNPEFVQAQTEYIAFNKSVLDVAQGAGLINGDTRAIWESDNYVPFYRIMEEGTLGPRGKKGLAGQVSGIMKLRGSDKHVGDPIENIMMNWSHLLDASVKNKAVLDTVSNLQGTGLMDKAPYQMRKRDLSAEQVRLQVEEALGNAGIEPGVADMLSSAPTLKGLIGVWSIEKPAGDNVIRVMNNGKPEYYNVNDTLLLRSLSAVTEQSWGGAMEFFRFPKRVLTQMVTADPAFMARNFIRDTLGAFILARDPMTPGVDAAKGFVRAMKENPEMVKFMAAGGTFSTGGYLNASDPGAMKRFVKAETHHAMINKTILNTPKRLWDFWQHLGASVENANRVGIGLSALKGGKDMAEAAYEMKDIMDFAMRGDYAAIQFLAESVPFFSARIQGMQRLARGAAEHPGAFAAKGMMLTMAALALYMANREDERYKELEDWDKDTYFHFWVGDRHYRLPKPFEVGVIFGTIPERMVEQMIQEDVSAKDFFERLRWNMTETLSLNPTPQIAKPLIETWANRSFFRDRPIVGMRLQRKAAEAQFEPWTSETMRRLGQTWGVSPKHAENLTRGYFGTIGSYVLAMSDVVTRRLYDFPEHPTMKLEEMPVISAFYRGKQAGRNTKYVTEFYDMVTEVDGLYGAINDYRKQRDPRADILREKNVDKLKYRNMLMARSGVVGRMNERIRQIHYNRNIDPNEKQRMIDELTAKKNKLIQNVVERAKDYDN